MATVSLKNNVYIVRFDYADLVHFKNVIPANGRRWDGINKCWLVDTQYGHALGGLFGVTVPIAGAVAPVVSTVVLDLRYMGQVKDRENGERTAFGYVGGDWSAIFPETVLKAWFEGGFDIPITNTNTLYGVLGIQRTATADEIKTGFRRMARQWHPDVCREPNANEMFLRIREAHDILSNDRSRARYDIGLKEQEKQSPKIPSDCYRSPLRCGYVLAEATEILGRSNVVKILGWEDIVINGKTLVTTWPMGAKTFSEAWV